MLVFDQIVTVKLSFMKNHPVVKAKVIQEFTHNGETYVDIEVTENKELKGGYCVKISDIIK